jgi:hypothetical protein
MGIAGMTVAQATSLLRTGAGNTSMGAA